MSLKSYASTEARGMVQFISPLFSYDGPWPLVAAIAIVAAVYIAARVDSEPTP